MAEKRKIDFLIARSTDEANVSFAPDAAQTAGAPEPKGVRGWLLLPAFITWVVPFTLLVDLIVEFPGYQQLWAIKSRVPVFTLALVGVETIVLLAFLVSWSIAIYFLTIKSLRYPCFSTALVLCFLAFQLFHVIEGAFYFGGGSANRKAIPAVTMIGVAAFWYTYMKFSKRVNNTFLN